MEKQVHEICHKSPFATKLYRFIIIPIQLGSISSLKITQPTGALIRTTHGSITPSPYNHTKKNPHHLWGIHLSIVEYAQQYPQVVCFFDPLPSS